jgi:chromosome partitioning protein
MGKVIAVFNQAGGVAKSTLCQNVGYGLGQRGFRVLLIDFDPQGSLSIFMGLNPWELETTVYDSLMHGKEILTYHLHGVDLLPSNRSLGKAEMELVLANMREQKLKVLLAPIQENYDYIFIDCPPSLGMLSYIALVTANQVLIPIQTEFKAYFGTDLLLETISIVKNEANPGLEIAGFVPTLYSKNKTQHRRVLQAIHDQLSTVACVFEPIPNMVAFSDASENRLPLELYDRKHEALKALNSIVNHIGGGSYSHV